MEQLPKINRRSPVETMEKIGGKTRAYHEISIDCPLNTENWHSKITFEYVSQPMPHYYLHTLDTNFGERGQGYASQVMDEFESMLRKKKQIGFLQDGIEHTDPACGMYQRRGWQKLDEHGVFMYNPRPGHYDDKMIEKLIKRYV